MVFVRKTKYFFGKSFWIVIPSVVLVTLFTIVASFYFIEIKPTQAAAATCYWVGDTSPANWNDATHWSNASGGAGSTCDGGVVPGSDDDVIFDSANLNDCNIDISPTVNSITNNTASYIGTLSLNGNTLTSLNNFTFGSGVLNLNSGNLTISGNIDIRGTTLDAGNSTVTMNGATSKYICGGNQTFYNLTISTTNYIPNSSAVDFSVSNILEVADGADLDFNYNVTVTINQGGRVDLNSTGKLDYSNQPSSKLILIDPDADTLSSSGTISVSVSFKAETQDIVVQARGYDNNIVIMNETASPWTATLGTVNDQTITSGGIWIYANGSGNMTVDATTYNPDVTTNSSGSYQYYFGFFGSGSGSEILNAGSGTWTVGASNVDFRNGTLNAGTSNFIFNRAWGIYNQEIYSGGNSFYEITNANDDSQGLIFKDNVEATTFTYTNLVGDLLTQFEPGTTASFTTFNVSGDASHTLTFQPYGSDSTWYLNVTNSPTVSYVSAKYSDASGGSTIDASNGTNTDSGNNENWDFGSRYWVAGSLGDWSDTSNWSFSSGGSSGATLPTTTTHVYFDSNGTGDCNINQNTDIARLTADATYGGTISANSYTMAVSGNLDLTGAIFSAGTSTITLDGSAGQTLTGNSQTINNLTVTNSDTSNGVTFSGNLTISGTLTNTIASAKMIFDNTAAYIVNNIILNGQALGTKIILESNSASDQWDLAVSGSQAISYVSVSDSDASSGNTVTADDGTNTNGGNNINWLFVGEVRYWVGSTSNWNDSNNWSTSSGGAGGASVPINADTAVFDDQDHTNCTVDTTIFVVSIINTSANVYTGIFAAATFAVNISGNFQFDGGTLDLGSGTWTMGGNWDTSEVGTLTKGTSTIVLNGASNTIDANNKEFNNITIDGATTLSSYFTVGGTLLVNTGKSLILGWNIITMKNGSTTTINGTVGSSDNGDHGMHIIDSAAHNLTASVSTTCTFAFISETLASINVPSLSGRHLRFYNNTSNDVTFTLVGDMDFSLSAIDVDSTGGLTLDASVNNPDITIGSDLLCTWGSGSGNRTLKMGSGTWQVARHANFTNCSVEAGISTLKFRRSNGTFTTNAQTFHNLTLDGSTWFDYSLLVSGNIILNGNLVMVQPYAGHTQTLNCAVNNPDVTIAGNISLTVANGTGIIQMGDGTWNVGGNINLTDGDIIADASTLILNGTSDQTITSASETFNNFRLNNTGIVGSDDIIISGALDIDGTFTLTDGDLDLDTSDPTVNIAGNITLDGGSISKSSIGSVVTFDGDLAYDDNVGNQNFGDIQIGASPDTTTLASNLTCDSLTTSALNELITTGFDIDCGGNINLDGTLTSAAGTDINLTGNWDSTGGVFANTGSIVTFDGSAAQTITSDSESFNNLTTVNSSAAGITFVDSAIISGTLTDTTANSKITFNASSAYTIANLTMDGGVGNLITLVSSVPTTAYSFNVSEANPAVTYIDVKDCDATGGSQIDAKTGGVNSGNNDNWLFAVDHVTVTPSSATLDQGASQSFSAQAFDASNALIPTATFIWSVVSGGGTIGGSGIFTAGTTAGTFSNTICATYSSASDYATVVVNEAPFVPTTDTTIQTTTAVTTADIQRPYPVIVMPDKAEVDTKIEFSAKYSSDNRGIRSYVWSFGDNSSSESSVVKHTYTSLNRYKVILTVTDTSGNSSSTYKFIDIVPYKPTLTSMDSKDRKIILKGISYPNTTIYITIHSDPYTTETSSNDKGKWQKEIDVDLAGIKDGEHKIFLSSEKVVTAFDQEITLSSSKVDYTLSLSDDGENLKVQVEELERNRIIMTMLIVLLLIVVILLIVKLKKKS